MGSDSPKNLLFLIRQVYRPIIVVSIFLSLITILIFYNFPGTSENTLLSWFNLNMPNTIADWFSVLIWIVCGLSFYLLGRKNLDTNQLKRKDKLFLSVFGILVCLISFEKIFHFHLMFEFRAINVLGLFSPELRKDSPYYWLFIFIIPLLLFILINLVISYLRLLKAIDEKGTKRRIIYYISSAVILMPMSVSFDVLQGYFWYEGDKHTVFNSIEAVLELAAICCIIGGNKAIAEFYSERK